MRFSVVIATCGDQKWGDLAFSRAFPSAREQRGITGAPPEIVVEHHSALSVSASRNAAAASASGDFLVFLDSDDELEPGYIAAMERTLLTGGITTDWAPLLVPAVRYVYPTEGRLPCFTERRGSEPGIPNRGLWPQVNECVVGTGIRRECFDEVGGFRDWPSIEDWDLFLRANDAGAQLVYVEDAVYRAHVNPEGRNRDQSCYAAIWAEHLGRTGERG